MLEEIRTSRGAAASAWSSCRGIAARGSVLANPCSEFIAHPRVRTGVLSGCDFIRIFWG